MIFLTGATGKIGGDTAKQVVANGARLRALVRDEAKAADLQAVARSRAEFARAFHRRSHSTL